MVDLQFCWKTLILQFRSKSQQILQLSGWQLIRFNTVAKTWQKAPMIFHRRFRSCAKQGCFRLIGLGMKKTLYTTDLWLDGILDEFCWIPRMLRQRGSHDWKPYHMMWVRLFEIMKIVLRLMYVCWLRGWRENTRRRSRTRLHRLPASATLRGWLDNTRRRSRTRLQIRALPRLDVTICLPQRRSEAGVRILDTLWGWLDNIRRRSRTRYSNNGIILRELISSSSDALD